MSCRRLDWLHLVGDTTCFRFSSCRNTVRAPQQPNKITLTVVLILRGIGLAETASENLVFGPACYRSLRMHRLVKTSQMEQTDGNLQRQVKEYR
jgi:hypothetical protein